MTARNGILRLGSACLALALLAYWTRRDSQFAFFASVWLLGAIAVSQGQWGRARARFFSGISWLVVAAYVIAAICIPKLLAVDPAHPLTSISVQFTSCLAYTYFIFFADSFGTDPPQWLVRSGDFSYSLYVIHFPLLLVILSLTQNWLGSSLERALIVCAIATITVLTAAFWFARYFEDQRHFKPHIKAVLGALAALGKQSAPVKS